MNCHPSGSFSSRGSNAIEMAWPNIIDARCAKCDTPPMTLAQLLANVDDLSPDEFSQLRRKVAERIRAHEDLVTRTSLDSTDAGDGLPLREADEQLRDKLGINERNG